MVWEFFEAVESREDPADVVALVGDRLDAVEGFVCDCHWAVEGRFVRVEAKGMGPGEGATAGHGVHRAMVSDRKGW